MRAIILDPGGTTGWLYWCDNHIEHGVLGPREHHRELWHFLSATAGGSSVRIICERFENRNEPFAMLMSNEYIGVVKCWHQAHYLNSTLVIQGASQAKRWATDDKLEVLGYDKIRPKHCKDAMRHWVYYVCNNTDMQGTEVRKTYMGLIKKLVTES
jgi:hypothetical protein